MSTLSHPKATINGVKRNDFSLTSVVKAINFFANSISPFCISIRKSVFGGKKLKYLDAGFYKIKFDDQTTFKKSQAGNSNANTSRTNKTLQPIR